MNILHIISSPRRHSFSVQLGTRIVDKLQTDHPGSTVTTRNLTAHPFPHLEEVGMQALQSPPEQHTPQHQAAARHSDEVIAEVQAADVVVIGAPMYNFGISSTLKAWIDHLARAGVTFRYTANGPQGLVTGKKVYVAVSSGGVYSQPPMTAYDFVTPYLKTVLGFLGMTDVTILRAEGTKAPGAADLVVTQSLETVAV